ncbi:MAG: alpha/beta fold hydrolase [Sphingopyxis sp.]
MRLHARIYDAPADADPLAPPVLCLPGLTRNARDFERLAPHLARHRRVYALNFRGRADSGYAKDAMTYIPLTYMQDIVALLEGEGLLAPGRSVATIGTSLGGLVSMLLAATHPGLVAAAVLNDVGPVVEPAGLARIGAYVGQGAHYPTWVHCARAVASANASIYPDWDLTDWLVMVKRSHRISAQGLIVPDYDAHIAQPMRAAAGAVAGAGAGVGAMWPAYDALAQCPTLVVRGALSDILSVSTVQRMVDGARDATLVTIAGIGHAPTLDEPAAVAAIDALLARIPAPPSPAPPSLAAPSSATASVARDG